MLDERKKKKLHKGKVPSLTYTCNFAFKCVFQHVRERKERGKKGKGGGGKSGPPVLFFWSKLRFFFYMWHEATALRQLHKSPTTMQCTRLTKSGCLNCNTHTHTNFSFFSTYLSIFLSLYLFPLIVSKYNLQFYVC